MSAPVVTQADRDAAADYLREWTCLLGDVENIKMRLGKKDDHPLVQAFARHRTAAEAASAATVAELVEVMGEYLPILSALQESGLWDEFAKGAGIATGNRYVAILARAKATEQGVG